MEQVQASGDLPKPEQWLGSVTGSVPPPPPPTVQSVPPCPSNQRRAPPLHSRALSLGSAGLHQQQPQSTRGPTDPFDAEWAEIAARNLRQAAQTNPFIMPNATQAFQVQL